MKHVRPVRLFILLLSCVIALSGALIIPHWDSPAAHNAAYQAEFLVNIAEVPVPYGSGRQVEVLPPSAEDPLAMEPYVAYSGGAIELRFYSASGTYQAKIGKDGRSSTMTLYADNSTHRIPLIYGDGKYTISIFEKLADGRARTVATKNVTAGTVAVAASTTEKTVKVKDTPSTGAETSSSKKWEIDTTDPYLTPVIDINWSDDLTSVKKARELCAELKTQEEMATAIYNHLVKRLSYDFDLVGKLPSGYVPSMDSTYSSKKGICYDITSLYAGMMRSVGVKCKMVMGYNTLVDGYHAWNEVYVDGEWKRVDITIDCQLRAAGSKYGFSSPKGSVTVKKSY